MSNRTKTRVIIEIDSTVELPDAEGFFTWEHYLTSERYWVANPENFRVTEIKREPIKGEKSDKQKTFESVVKEMREPSAYPYIDEAYNMAADFLAKEIERMEGER